jgi:hypothetical protein
MTEELSVVDLSLMMFEPTFGDIVDHAGLAMTSRAVAT